MEQDDNELLEFLGTFKVSDARTATACFRKEDIKFAWKHGDSGLIDLPLEQAEPDALLRLYVHNRDIEKASRFLSECFAESKETV